MSLKNILNSDNPEVKELLSHINELSFNALPDYILNDPDNTDGRRYFTVSVVKRNVDAWAVTDYMGHVYGRDLEDSYEPLPSSRDEDFIAKYRFSLAEAVEIAEKVMWKLRINRFDVNSYKEFYDAYKEKERLEKEEQ